VDDVGVGGGAVGDGVTGPGVLVTVPVGDGRYGTPASGGTGVGAVKGGGSVAPLEPA